MRRWWKAGCAAVLALTAGACTGNGGADVATPAGELATMETSTSTGDVYAIQGCEPGSLLPADITEDCGRQVAEALYTGLVAYDPVDNEPRWGAGAPRSVAETITSVDGRRWTIELESGWTFHDGTPVTAQSFADGWNAAAYGPNAHPNAFLFQRIRGFEDVRCADPACTEPRPDPTLQGIEVVDESTLQVTLDAPFRLFPWLLGHAAMAPVPPAAFQDPEAFRETPVGNGPLRIDGPWVDDGIIRLRPFEDYPDAPASGAADVVLYDDPAQAVADFDRGELDVLTEFEPDHVQELRRDPANRIVARQGDGYVFLVVPTHSARLADRQLAAALSMAIDRQALIEEHLAGGAVPANSLVPPLVSVLDEDTCGEACRYQPDVPRRLFEAAGGLPPGGLAVWSNRGSGHEPWLHALTGRWRETFGADEQAFRVTALPVPQFMGHVEDRKIDGLYRLGWAMDYPSPGNYLRPLHDRDGLFNFDGYSNVEVDSLLDLADRADTVAQSVALYRRAEQLVLEDWHHIPLWFELHRVVHSDAVANIELDPFGRVRLADVAVEAS